MKKTILLLLVFISAIIMNCYKAEEPEVEYYGDAYLHFYINPISNTTITKIKVLEKDKSNPLYKDKEKHFSADGQLIAPNGNLIFLWWFRLAHKDVGKQFSQLLEDVDNNYRFYEGIYLYDTNTNFVFKITNTIKNIFNQSINTNTLLKQYYNQLGGFGYLKYSLTMSNSMLTNSYYGTMNE